MQDFAGRRIAVHNHTSLGVPFRDPVFYVDELAAAIGLPTNLLSDFDLDGLMTSGEEILFSIAPIAGVFDGGEIWTWNKAVGGAASFLDHGGHLWDTDFEVMLTFGTASENVDALEAVDGICPPNVPCQVPEPNSAWGLLALGVFGAGSMLKRQLKKQKSAIGATIDF